MDNHIFIFYLLINHLLIKNVDLTEKICFRLNSGGIESFCCNNHIRNNGQCVECELGTKSKTETICEPCTPGKYGRECSNSCNCKITERCDRTYGCIVDDNMATTELTINLPKLSQVTLLKESRSSVAYADAGKIKEKGITSQSYAPGYTRHNNKPATKLNDETVEHVEIQEFSDREVFVYSIGSAIFLVFISCVCVTFLCLYKFKTTQSKMNLTEPSPDFNLQNVNGDDGSNSHYESIDEHGISHDSIQVENNGESIENDSSLVNEADSSPQESETSSYLHPYVTLIKSDETHAYCSLVGSYSSDSSSFSVVERNSEYTNSYEQTTQTNRTGLQTEYEKLYPYLDLQGIGRMANAQVSGQSVHHNAPSYNFTSGELFELKRTKSFENDNSIKLMSGFVEIGLNSVDRTLFSARPKSLCVDNENDKKKVNNSFKHLSA